MIGIHLSDDHVAILLHYARQIDDDDLRGDFFKFTADLLRPCLHRNLNEKDN